MTNAIDRVVVHTHVCKPKHRCRCISAKGGCPKCASERQRKEFWALVERASK
jgi:hypothetical protein